MSRPTATDSPDLELHDCWNLLGVWGNNECPELKSVVHCRNCPVYSSAAAKLLDRELPVGYREEWAKHYSNAKDTGLHETHSAVVFRIGSEWLGLPANTLQEVMPKRSVHGLPHRRNGAVLGVVNVRGQLLVCVSIAALLAIDSAASSKLTEGIATERFIVWLYGGNRIVFPAEEIGGVEGFEVANVLPVPATLAGASAMHMKGVFDWRGKSVGLLDSERLSETVARVLR